MLDKMGLTVNRDEAQMMLISLDENGDRKVTLGEFLDLVFTHNDALSGLDMTKMHSAVGTDDLTIMDEIKRNVEKTQKQRPMNQWKLFLSKNLNNIAMDLLTVDQDREYTVDIKDFMKVIDRRAKIPGYLKQNNGDLLHEFISGYTDSNERVDYRSLIEELRNFDYELANASKEPYQTTQFEESKVPRRTIFEDDYTVLDS